MLIAVITGDIINSRGQKPEHWINELKSSLSFYGETPIDWEIYRGDSFQMRLEKQIAMLSALHIKSTIKQFEELDVRMSIGLGEQEYKSTQITESNGAAFVRSGEGFDALKKQNIILKSDNDSFDQTINLMLSLSLLTTNRWTPSVAKVIKYSIENKNLKQQEIAKRLNKSQSTISESLKRGGFDEIMKMNDFYDTQISQLC